MGLGVLVVGITVALTAAATAFAVFQNQTTANPENLSPSTDFNPTVVKEGTIVPTVYGRVRLRGFLIHWGNLVVVEILEKQEGGGKGGGSESQTTVTGHKYFVDIQQTICKGKVNLIAIYADDKKVSIDADTVLFNDGTESTFMIHVDKSGNPLEFQSHLNPIAHYNLRRWFIGENRTTMPGLEFVVERDLSSLPVIGGVANLASGSNPAAVIMDLLLERGVEVGNIDTASFLSAANHFASLGYGLNFVLDKQDNLGNIIKKVQNWVDLVLHRDEQGRFVLRALNPADIFVDTISEQDMNSFSLNRKSWRQTKNDFIGTFISEADDFKQRTVVTNNPAAIKLARNSVEASIDLKCFRDATTASKRLTELMKRESYPKLTVKIKTNWKYASRLPGEIIRVSHSDYGIVSADFRIKKIDATKISNNEINIEAEQQIETLFDDIFLVGGGSDYNAIKPDFGLVPLTNFTAFELPYNTRTLENPAWMVLAQREKAIETKFLVQVSNNPSSDFSTIGEFTTFSLHGTLDAIYPDTTFQIDDKVGILFTATKIDPVFDTIQRAEMYTTARFIIIGNEMMVFEKWEPQSGNQIKLLGVTRGVLHTPKETHGIGSDIWIGFLSSNVIENIGFTTFYLKVIPQFLANVLDPSLVTAIEITRTNKALAPVDPGRLVATKTGSNVDLQIYPISHGVLGAGDKPESETDGPPPFDFRGDFEISGDISPNVQIKTSDFFTIAPTVFPANITVKSRVNNKLSPGKTINIGTTDGQYIA